MSVRKMLAGAVQCLGAAALSSTAHAWSLEEAAKPYAGTTIKCVGDGYSPFVAYQKLATEQGPFIISAFFNTLAAHADYVENFPLFKIGIDMPFEVVTLSSKAPKRA